MDYHPAHTAKTRRSTAIIVSINSIMLQQTLSKFGSITKNKIIVMIGALAQSQSITLGSSLSPVLGAESVDSVII